MFGVLLVRVLLGALACVGADFEVLSFYGFEERSLGDGDCAFVGT